MNNIRNLCRALVAAHFCLTAGCSPPGDESNPSMSAGERLSGDASGFAQVLAPKPFRFPVDHGPHPQYKHEWWYVTGRASDAEGRVFGFQFTVFREAISSTPIKSDSRWATNQIYLAHAALTDPTGERYISDERFARGALDLAGATAPPLRVWLEDWQLEGRADDQGNLTARIVAGNDRFGFDLQISNVRPPVAHGNQGLSAKGPADNASYYYSYTRLDASGVVRVNKTSFEVTGHAWFDHEWSSSALQSHQSGWDWFSLQLSNGADLMAFRLRHRTEPDQDFYSGTLVAPSGEVTVLSSDQIVMKVIDHWTSETSGVRYPSRWRLSVPDLGLELKTAPLLDEQEFSHSFRYWEGAVRASGHYGGDPVTGGGYIELAGYEPDHAR